MRSILNTRYNDSRTTIITSNFDDEPAAKNSDPDAIVSRSNAATRAAGRDDTLGDRIGERMRSRLHEMCRVVSVQGGDFRQTLRRASFR